jgi:hypothetical protein
VERANGDSRASCGLEETSAMHASMSVRGFWLLDDVADELIERRLVDLLRNGSRTEARVLAHLAEMDERRLHLSAGFGSLFEYCLKQLGMSEDEGMSPHRRSAARAPVSGRFFADRRTKAAPDGGLSASALPDARESE